jgi:cyclic pyranopterin phosphate synthase
MTILAPPEQSLTRLYADNQRIADACARGLPTVVEVEVNSRCNRSCGYCPVSVLPVPSAPKVMPLPVFETLLVQLREIQFAGRFSYHFYNEPLLRRDLEVLVATASSMLPHAVQVLYTNGDLLVQERYDALVAAGIRHFVITQHDSLREKIPARPLQTLLVPADLNLTNRGGTLFKIGEPLRIPCFAPSEMLIVTATGDVLLCYEDAQRQNVMGNITVSSLSEIWNSEQFVDVRKVLADGERASAGMLCRQCDNCAHSEPGTSWLTL